MRASRPLRLPLAAVLALAALVLSGCVEVEERLAFERDGNGTYAVTLRWNADLLQRVRETVGERAMAALEGRAFPLRVEDWREGLRGLTGLTVASLEERVEEGGWRSIRLEVRFAALDDLLRWELFGRRTLSVKTGEDPRRARLAMHPFTRLALLDPLRDVHEVRRAPPLAGEARDPGPLERLGLEPAAAALVERLLAPHLARVRLTSSVAPAGRIGSAGRRAVEVGEREARFSWTWPDLLAGVPRAVELDWTAGEFDRIPTSEHPGDEPLAEAAAASEPAAGAPPRGG